MRNPLARLNRGKIAIAIGIGILVSGWMLYRSVNQPHFVNVSSHPVDAGNHIWVDGNGNGVVDVHDPEDFQRSSPGNYRKTTVSETLWNINWSAFSWWWIGVALLFTAGRDLFYILRIRLLTRRQLSWRASFYVIMLWEFASALSPGIVGGAAVAMFILNRETIPFGKATAIVIITAFMDNLFFVVMIPFVFLFIHHHELFPIEQSSARILTWWFWGGVSVVFGICLVLYLTLFWYPKLATRFLLFVFRLPFLRRWKFIAKEWGKDIEQAAKEFKTEPLSYWWKTFGLTVGSWICRYLVINAIMSAFLTLGFIDHVKILGKQLILWLFMLVSPTPGGSGIAEYSFSELLSSFSSSAILVATMAILWRLISYFPYIFLGSVLLPTWLRRTQKR